MRAALAGMATPERARLHLRFFKTGQGEYGEGDRFLGVTVPQARAVARVFAELPFPGVAELLASPIHEHRLVALMILVRRYARGDEATRKAVYDMYVGNLDRVNNWDLVDLSAEYIIGPHLEQRSRAPLLRLARSPNLWRRRVAIISTFHFIRCGDPSTTLEIAEMLLDDPEDLIHKATGWMLREIGKRHDEAVLLQFLDRHAPKMPRTMLRYAIERLPPKWRAKYLAA